MDVRVAHRIDYLRRDEYPLLVGRAHFHEGVRDPLDLTETPHRHDFQELVIVAGGVGVHRLDTFSFPITEGDVFVVREGQIHWFENRADLELVNIMFDPIGAEFPLQRLTEIPAYRAFFLAEPAVRGRTDFGAKLTLPKPYLLRALELAREIRNERTSAVTGYPCVLLSRFLDLVILICRFFGENPNPRRTALLRIGDIIGLLETEYLAPWDLRRLASRAGLSIRGLLYRFEAATGMSPIEYLNEIRLNKAKSLLEESGSTITDIAFQCGFNDSNYFSRRFKRRFGVSPREWRNAGPYP